jgi:hypothetical protein
MSDDEDPRYIILEFRESEDLQYAVNEKLSLGYKLVGQPVMSSNPGKCKANDIYPYFLCQAMAK